MKEALDKLTPEQVKFICDECDLTEEQLLALSDDEVYDKVYETMCDIEIAETPIEEDEEESERCVMASDLVTLLGNTLPRDSEE